MIIVLWVIFIAFFASPIIVNFASGAPADEIESIIAKEAEVGEFEIIAQEEEGNKAMYAFKTEKDFGVAVFTHYADNYSYDEGTMSNGEKYIDVSLDTGWDVYAYKVTKDGAELTAINKMSGTYRMYAIIAGLFAIITVICLIYGKATKKKKETARKRGLIQ